MNFVLTLRNIRVTKALIFFTYLGSWQVIFGLSVIAVTILLLFRKKRETFFLVAALISGLIVRLLSKPLFHRQRPDIRFSLISENGYSFPSGHALMSVIFYGMICYFIYKLCRKTWQKLISLIAFVTLIFLIGLSRIYLGVHWTSDVIAGWLIGFTILVFFIIIYERLKKYY